VPDQSADSEASEPAIAHRNGAVLTLVLNRPARRNALTGAMVSSITEAVLNAGSDNETRAILIRAEGKDFCSGFDLAESNRADRGATRGSPAAKPRTGHVQRGFPQGAHRMIQAIWSVQLPVVAAVKGWAAGIGNALALSADVTVAAESARFWVPFVTKGFTPDSGTSWLLPRLVGLARAKEMILLGKPVDGRTAADWGLISQCVEDADLEQTAASVAAQFATMATVSVGLAKPLIHGNLESPFAVALQNEGMYEELAVRSDDFKEGMRAFSEKRAPKFTGW
jgi:2-(1,2-epoxy-1,2-dihydrophenyl)acetyl-CoA isomerase